MVYVAAVTLPQKEDPNFGPKPRLWGTLMTPDSTTVSCPEFNVKFKDFQGLTRTQGPSRTQHTVSEPITWNKHVPEDIDTHDNVFFNNFSHF